MGVLTGTKPISQDVLKIRHRTSEPFDHPIDPTALATIVFGVGSVMAINASGYVERANHASLATQSVIGLSMLPSVPSDARKNNYIQASGNASIFSNGIVVLDTQLTDATIAARDKLYLGTNGVIVKTDPGTGKLIGWAMTARTVLGAEVIVKLEL